MNTYTPSGSGIITDIQHYSLHDGPGIRTVVFLKGCPLSCAWCQNPETVSPAPQLSLHMRQCIGCGRCLSVCPTGAISISAAGGIITNRLKCTVCEKCSEVCFAHARTLIGKKEAAENVISRVIRDRVFFDNSGGGITLSGGEPLLQPEFSKALLKGFKAFGIHTAMETSGLCSANVFADIIGWTDMLLYDIKHTDCATHKKYTGVGNERILSNLNLAGRLGKQTVIRVPFIPQINDDDGNMRRIAELAAEINALEIHLLPFHQLGLQKWRDTGQSYALKQHPEPTSEALVHAKELLGSAGAAVVIGGHGCYASMNMQKT